MGCSSRSAVPLALGVASLLFAACNPSVRLAADGGSPQRAPDLSLWFEDPDLLMSDPEDLARYRDRDAACAQERAEATLVKRPVDIIFVIDNSGSMSDEIHGVENNINQNFAQIIGKSGLDYRVIMVTSHGLYSRQMICVGKPLSGHDCMPPPPVPVNTKRYFHYDYNVQSTDSFTKLIKTYNLPDSHGLAPMGWAGYLRKDSIKMFVEITDDRSTLDEMQFDQQLLALKPALFGTAMKRNYIWHSIVGVVANNPKVKPWGPKDPFQATKCTPGAVNEGPQYQRLSILTGGLRFPICEWASFDGVFLEIAKGVISGSKVVCEMEVPKPPPDQEIDYDTLLLEYENGKTGAVEDFAQVPSAQDCVPDAFYRVADRIYLCPDTCARVQADDTAKLRVLFDCAAPPG